MVISLKLKGMPLINLKSSIGAAGLCYITVMDLVEPCLPRLSFFLINFSLNLHLVLELIYFFNCSPSSSNTN